MVCRGLRSSMNFGNAGIEILFLTPIRSWPRGLFFDRINLQVWVCVYLYFVLVLINSFFHDISLDGCERVIITYIETCLLLSFRCVQEHLLVPLNRSWRVHWWPLATTLILVLTNSLARFALALTLGTLNVLLCATTRRSHYLLNWHCVIENIDLSTLSGIMMGGFSLDLVHLLLMQWWL